MKLHNFVFSPLPRYRFTRHLVFWICRSAIFYAVLWAIYFSMPIGNEDPQNIKNAITFEFIGAHLLFDIFYTYVVAYVLVPRFFRPKYILFVLALTAFTVFVLLAKTYAGLRIAHITEPGNLMFGIAWGEIQEFLNSFGPPAICAVFMTIRMLKNWVIDQDRKKFLIRENANAELEILKAQVHPHFLFNTLNNIYYFAANKSPDATLLLNKLSAIMNYMMIECEDQYVPLRAELALLRNYLELQGVRYGPRLRLITSLPDGGDERLITPLLLIPFVENSFKHGASKILGNPDISLIVETTGEQLNFRLKNNKPPTGSTAPVAGGIGLLNVKKRLELLYPHAHSLKIEDDGNSFQVDLTIPLVTREKRTKKHPAYVG